MNWEHLKAFLWLRWRIVANRNRRAGKGSVILQWIFTGILLAGGLLALVVGTLVGALVLPRTSGTNIMLIWDGIVVLFLFFWMTELLVELQRSELLSLDKFLHLPVSLSSAFLINYVGSLSSVGVILFLPLMLGLSIGLVIGTKEPMMLLMFPLVAAFALMITALTHQFRGWLASLMVNQRRRRTVISLATLAFVLLVQTPNIINFASGRWRSRPGTAQSAEIARKTQELDRARASKEITREEYRRRVRELREPGDAETWKSFQDVAKVANQIVPLGWLPYGAAASFEGKTVPGLLGIVGLTLIGAGSLRRSYRTTIRLYTGQFTAAAHPAREAAPSAPASAAAPRHYPARFLEKRISGLSEHAAAVTVTSFRSWTRAPEAKLLLLSPIIMLLVFGGMFFNQANSAPEMVRPLIVSGAFTMMFFMLLSMVGNQFGFDRSGFRVYVLSPAPRKDILLGKNLSMAPFLFAFMLLFAVLIEIFQPMRVDHFLGVLIQTVPMFLVYCLIGNLLSIIAPMPTAAGSMKPVKPKATTLLIQMAFVFMFPVALTPILIPLGIEFLLRLNGTLLWFPAYLLFMIVECALALWLYPMILKSEGQLLARREQKILEVVTTKAE